MIQPPTTERSLSRIQARLARIDPGVLVVAALPWLLLYARVAWVFSGMGLPFIDPYVYLGFFLDLPSYLRAFRITYYAGRLSWLLPGHVAYKLCHPLTGTYLLHFGFYYASVFSLYLILKVGVSRRAALVGSILMGSYCYFLWAVGWDYVDGAGITYGLMTMAALTYGATHRRWWFWLGVGGALYGAMIYSQLFLVVFTPPLLVYYYGLSKYREHSLRFLLPGIGCFIFGFLAISLFFAAINHSLNGNFLFFLSSVNFLGALAKQPNPLPLPFSTWMPTATWLTFPALTCFGSIGFLILARSTKSDGSGRFRLLLQVYFLICTFIFVVFEIIFEVEVFGQPVLQSSIYAGYLIPAAFLAAGAQLAPILDRLNWRSYALLTFGIVTISLLAYVVPPGIRLAQWVVAHALFAPAVVAATGAVLIVLKRLSVTGMSCLLLSVMAVFLSSVNGAFRRTTAIWKDPETQRHEFLAVVQGVRVVQGFKPTGSTVFWYNLDEPMGNLFRSVASAHLWANRLINERFPNLQPNEPGFEMLKLDTRVVVLSNEKYTFQRADGALTQLGFWTRPIGETTVRDGPVTWRMVFIECLNRPIIESVQLAPNGWPEAIHLQLRSHKQRVIPLLEPKAYRLFSSDMDTPAGWSVFRYRQYGGLEIKANCFAFGDNCGEYSSGDKRDHLASPFLRLGPERSFIFFSLWVKALQGRELPTISVQDDRFSILAEGRELVRRPDGWVLVGNLSDVHTSQQFRLLVIQPPGTPSLLDKALLVNFADRLLPAQEATEAQR